MKLLQRGWWKPWNWSMWTWAVAIVLATLASPLVTRWVCLWRVSDVQMPFSVEDVIQPDIPQDEDAFARYGVALQTLRPNFGMKLNDMFEQAMDNPDSNWDEQFQGWLVEQVDALAEYQQAGDMPQASGTSLKYANFATLLPVHQDMRELYRFGAVQAIRFERAGELDKAWACHRANLQAGVHTERPGLPICELIGTAIRISAYGGIARWASNPSLTPEQLKAARIEIGNETARRMSILDVAKAEYLTVRNSLLLPDGPDALMQVPQGTGPAQGPTLAVKRFMLWCVGQPDLTLRLGRQLLVNNASELDEPLYRRRRLIRGPKQNQCVFELDPHESLVPGQMGAAQLDWALDNDLPSIGARTLLLTGTAQVDGSRQRENARLAALMVLLKAHEYQRVHGQFPDSLEQLIPAFFDVLPFDPTSIHHQPLKYRREENGNAIVWSVGDDQTDDGGNIEGNKPTDIGFRIQLKELKKEKEVLEH